MPAARPAAKVLWATLWFLTSEVRFVASGGCAEYGCSYYDTENDCQCNPSCREYYSCCDDYAAVCVNSEQDSCSPENCDSYDATRSCQCYAGCDLRNECCPDFKSVCQGEGGAADGSLRSTPRPASTTERAGGAQGAKPSPLVVLAYGALACVLLCLVCGGAARCMLAARKRSSSKQSRLADAAPSDQVFRLSATKDRYGYYEEMERSEEAESMIPWGEQERFQGRKVVVVLEKAALEQAAAICEGVDDDDECELLIAHECLLALLDSPLNKAGHLLVYLHSAQGVLVEVHPALRVPRAFRRFAAVVAELLRTHEVQGKQATFPLLRVVEGPVQRYFPRGCRCYGIQSGGRVRKSLQELADRSAPSQVLVFAVSASMQDALSEKTFGQGYIQERMAVCPWGLRAAASCAKVCNEFEVAWGACNSNRVLVEELPPKCASVQKQEAGSWHPCSDVT